MYVGVVGHGCDDGEVEEYLGDVGKGYHECCVCTEQGDFARECVLRGGKEGAGKGQKGEGVQWGGKAKGSPPGSDPEGGRGLDFSRRPGRRERLSLSWHMRHLRGVGP